MSNNLFETADGYVLNRYSCYERLEVLDSRFKPPFSILEHLKANIWSKDGEKNALKKYDPVAQSAGWLHWSFDIVGSCLSKLLNFESKPAEERVKWRALNVKGNWICLLSIIHLRYSISSYILDNEPFLFFSLHQFLLLMHKDKS